MKSCRRCKVEKPLEEFRVHGPGQKEGKTHSYCRRCEQDAHRRRRYGIEPDDYDRMYAELDGCCPLCGVWYAKLAVDHCHATGRVRGLLCLSCNRTLGYVEDDEWMKKAKAYLNAV